jgi:hypothetical protein
VFFLLYIPQVLSDAAKKDPENPNDLHVATQKMHLEQFPSRSHTADSHQTPSQLVTFGHDHSILVTSEKK